MFWTMQRCPMKSQHPHCRRFAPARLRRGKPYRCANQWPRDLPDLREACLAYAAALEWHCVS
jgi:isopenicillin N synthase-like dioxygenase